MANFTLLEEADIEERKLQMEATSIDKNSPGSVIVQFLLPKYKILNDKVRAYHDTRAREPELHGGIRGGKTTAEAAEAVKLSWYNMPYPHVEWSETQENGEETIAKEIKKLLKESAVKFKYTKINGHFRIYWGEGEKNVAHIYCLGINNFIKGLTFASSGYNEAYSIKREKFLIAEERASYEAEGLWYKKTKAGTCEPRKMDWGHDNYKKPDIISDDKFKVTLRTEDNPYLSEKYIQELKEKYTPEEQEVYMNGIYTNLAAGRIYTEFSIEKNVRPYSEYLAEERGDEVYRIIVSFDFNVNPMTAVEHDIKDKMRRQIMEHRINKSHTAELCEMIVDKLKIRFPGIEGKNRHRYLIYVTGDASGKRFQSSSGGWSDHDIIKKIFFASGMQIHIAFEASNPPVEARTGFSNNLYSRELAIIYDNCPYTIKDRELGCWKKGAEGYAIDKSNSEISHLNDASDYGLWLTARMGIDNVETDDTGSVEFFGERRRTLC